MATSVTGAETKAAVSEAYVRDAMLGWFRGEFAAANAIIDELCGHLAQMGGVEEYESSFAAIHRRRLNWIPVLHMQKYYTIAEVAAELRLVSANRSGDYCLLEDPRESDLEKPTEQESAPVEEAIDGAEVMQSEAQMAPEEYDGAPMEETAEGERDALGKFEPPAEAAMQSEAEKQAERDGAQEEEKSDAAEAAVATDSAINSEEPLEHAEEVYSGDSSDRKGVEDGDEANGGSQEEQAASTQNPNACGEQSVSGVVVGRERIKILKGFVAKESVKGHMVNVLKGLKMYEGIFTDSELLSVTEFINELRPINSLSGMVPGDICSLGGNNSIVGQFDSLGSGLINHMDAMTSIQYSAGSVLHEPVPGFEHVSGSPACWSQEEITILHIGLVNYSHLMGIRKYTKISAMLPKKTIRDVALRCQGITHKETGKRQKMKENSAARKTKDMLDKTGSPSSTANISMSPELLTGKHMKIQHSIPSEAPSLEHILDENNKLMDEIAKNIDGGMLEENINLFHYVKNNISIIENRISVMSTTMNKFPGSMRQMPILRISINDELLASLIHHTNNIVTGTPPMNNYQLDTTCIRPNIRGFREHT